MQFRDGSSIRGITYPNNIFGHFDSTYLKFKKEQKGLKKMPCFGP